MKRILSVLLALVMVIGMLPMSILSASAAEGTWTLVTDASTLKVGDQVIIAAKDANYALSTTQNSNNRGQASITKSNNTATFSSGVEVITLEEGATTGTFAFKVSAGYLYCASTSTKNYLRTKTAKDASGSWTISVATNNAATVTSQISGTTRNKLYYNSSSSIFACYGSVQKDICLYKLVKAEPNPGETECAHANTTNVAEVPATCTTAGTKAGVQCADCEAKISGFETIAALGHDWSAWAQTTAPGCTTAGEETASCSRCTETKTQTVAATGHTLVNGVCSSCGTKQLDMSKATAIAVGDEITFVCETASVEMNDFYGTSYAYGTAYTDAPMGEYLWTVVAGASEGTYAFVNSDKAYLAWTSGNSAKTSDTLNTNSSWTVSFEDGNAVVKNVADATRQLQWNATSPRFACYALKDDGTMTQTAIQIYVVAAEGEVEPDPEEPTEPDQPAGEHDSHDTGIAEEKAPTCTEPGNTAGMFCNDCEVFFDGAEVIPALGHNYVDGACSVCGDAKPSTPAESTATITFDDTAKRTEGTTSKQVWEENGIVVTNTGSVNTKYYNPVRFYKSSQVVIAFAGMTKIEVVCNTAEYATTLKDSIKDDNAAVSVNGNVVTIVLSAAADSYSITMSAGQVRVDSITVASSECAHNWSDWQTVNQASCETEGLEKSVCSLCGEEKTQTVAKTSHTMTNGTCSVCGAEYYTLSTTLNNNDSVIIYYPANKVAMTTTVSGSRLAGTSVVIDESGLLGNSDVAIMKVQYVEGSDTDFYLICEGQYLTSAAAGNGLSFASEENDYAIWYLQSVEGGDSTVYVCNKNAVKDGKVQALEYYSNCFTTYGIKTDKIYYFQLYTKGENDIACEHAWSDWEIVTNATCTTAGEQKSVCANCGDEKTQTIAATGHTYVFGDEAVTCTAGDVNVAKSEIGNVPKTADANVYYVEGIVTFVDGGTVYIQDTTGGVALRLANGVSAPKVGEKVEAVGSCSVYNGLIQLQNAYFETVSSGNTVEAQAVTLAELKADTDLTYLSVKVAMKGLTVTAAENYNATYKNVDYTVTDGTNFFKLYRAPAASADTVLKAGDVINVVGVVGIYNADYQLRVVDASDIVIVPTVKMTHISLSPANDALGFKVQLNGIDPAKVTEYGVTFTVNGMSKTYKLEQAPNGESISARVQGIMEAGGGEMKITGQFYVIVNGEKIYSDEQTTCMMDAIKAVNEITTLSDAQKAAVYGLYTDHASVIDAWLGETNNIKDWATTVV